MRWCIGKLLVVCLAYNNDPLMTSSLWNWSGKGRAIFEFHLLQKRTWPGDVCRHRMKEQTPSSLPSPVGGRSLAGFWTGHEGTLLSFAFLLIDAARVFLAVCAVCPWNCTVEIQGLIAREPPRRTRATDDGELAEKQKCTHGLVGGNWPPNWGASLAPGPHLQKAPLTCSCVCIWSVGKMTYSSNTSMEDVLLHPWNVSRVCFVLNCVSLLPLEDFVVVYGFKDINMAKIQEEPDCKEHSESMSGFWVGEFIGV